MFITSFTLHCTALHHTVASEIEWKKSPWLLKTINIGILLSACAFCVQRQWDCFCWPNQLQNSIESLFNAMRTQNDVGRYVRIRCFRVDNIFSTCNFLIYFVYRIQWPITYKTSKQDENKEQQKDREQRREKEKDLFIYLLIGKRLAMLFVHLLVSFRFFLHFCVCYGMLFVGKNFVKLEKSHVHECNVVQLAQ